MVTGAAAGLIVVDSATVAHLHQMYNIHLPLLLFE